MDNLNALSDAELKEIIENNMDDSDMSEYKEELKRRMDEIKDKII